MSDKYQGACFCGAVQIEVTGEPQVMGYCHCRSCRSWSGGPVNAFTIFPADAVTVTKGGQYLATFRKTPDSISDRQYCTECGGHLMTSHPPLGAIDVSAATIPGLPFVASIHVNYQETVLPMKDGLPKFVDFPAGFGGSDKTMGE